MANKNYTPINPDLIGVISKPKEAEPILFSSEKIELKEASEHRPEEEVKPYISLRHETIELPPDLKKMGLQSSTTSQFSSYQNIKLPLADEKIVVGLHAPITSSIRWLATLAIYILRMAHLSLRTIHGRVIRVIKN